MALEAGIAQRGSFTDDLSRWEEIWGGQPGFGSSKLKRLRLLAMSPPLQATALLRLSSTLEACKVPLIPTFLHQLTIMMFGLDIVPGIPIGGGLYIPHPVGTVVMAARLGRNVTLVSNVTIGMRDVQRFPVIGDNVYVGAGARILGDIEIGNGAVIGANAVVLTDVPPGATAVGIPARIIPHDSARDHGKF